MDQNTQLIKCLELATAAGRRRKSPLTGFIHANYSQLPEDIKDTIPLLENAYFSLALMKSKMSENIVEAKSLIDKILCFQNHEEESTCGNFPLYLHEYPICRDRWAGIRLGMALHWILKDFSSILGSQLKCKIQNALSKIIQHGWKMYREKPAPYSIGVKLAALSYVSERVLVQETNAHEGKTLLEELSKQSSSWDSPETIGAVLSALQIVYPRISESPWASFWNHALYTWNSQIQCYVGPPNGVLQEGNEPLTCLYDIYMSAVFGKISQRIAKDHLFHLEASLIHNLEENLACAKSNGHQKWHLENKYACSYIADESKTPFRLLWGSSERPHSLICEGGMFENSTYTITENGVDLFFRLMTPSSSDHREENREILFFSDLHEEMTITVEGARETTFRLGEKIVLTSEGIKIHLQFDLIEGSGKFLGHIMMGNRPSQFLTKGNHRFSAFDWILFLRTIHRTEHCIIKVSIQVLNESSDK